MKSPVDHDRFGNGEFAGQVRAHLESIGRTLDEIKGQLRSVNDCVVSMKVSTASLRTQVRILWAAASMFGVTLLGLTLKLMLGGGT